jgi:hypothetical protein
LALANTDAHAAKHFREGSWGERELQIPRLHSRMTSLRVAAHLGGGGGGWTEKNTNVCYLTGSQPVNNETAGADFRFTGLPTV